MPHEVETMAYWRAEGAPWHGLGVPVNEAMDSEQALVRAGLAWAVVQRPLYTLDPASGEAVEVPGWRANVRATDNAVLGVVTTSYRPVQNREAFTFMDALLGEGVRYTTAGSLRGGRRIFLCALLPDEYRLAGDLTAPYVVLSNAHDGSGGVRVSVTPIRVVCMNTLNLSLRRARRSWTTRHVGNLQGRLREAAQVLGLVRRYMRFLEEEADRLANTAISLEDYIYRLLPIPEDATDQQRRTIAERRLDIAQRALVDNLLPFHGTAWQFINAVADHVAHAEPTRRTAVTAERRAEAVINGHPLLDRAYGLVMGLN